MDLLKRADNVPDLTFADIKNNNLVFYNMIDWQEHRLSTMAQKHNIIIKEFLANLTIP